LHHPQHITPASHAATLLITDEKAYENLRENKKYRIALSARSTDVLCVLWILDYNLPQARA
jgi:hypothetical protein